MTDHNKEDRRLYWNERYTERGALWGGDANQFVVRYLSDLPPGTVLDLASGQGRNAVWLAARGHSVTAVDISDVAARQAGEVANEAGVDVEFVTADLLEWEPEAEAYDLVLLSYLQVPSQTRRAVHHKAIRAVTPGGVVFVIAHHLDNYEHGVGGPPDPDVLFTEDQLAGDFEDLDIEVLERVFRRVESEDVTGEAIDVAMLARKPK
jgi:ubiquinone/menaquinone biosynthesis C-methylase UbiE